ncbi:hypothetical protein [Bacillus sp. FSL R12-0069]|uniref:hypothetical protein n=1 Tax=Bacillus sp. FSL R12-0069 TaxID=2975342 RepID=UPI0030F4D14C
MLKQKMMKIAFSAAMLGGVVGAMTMESTKNLAIYDQKQPDFWNNYNSNNNDGKNKKSISNKSGWAPMPIFPREMTRPS